MDESQASKDRIAAGRELLNRGFGQAPQTIKMEGDQSQQMEMIRRTLLEAATKANAGMGQMVTIDATAVTVDLAIIDTAPMEASTIISDKLCNSQPSPMSDAAIVTEDDSDPYGDN